MERPWFIVSMAGLTVLWMGLGCCGRDGEDGAPSRLGSRALVVTEIEQGQVVNRPPRFLSLAPLAAKEGAAYTYDFDVLDPDGDEVSYTLVEAPEGAALDGKALTWVPRPAQAGRSQRFTLRAVDEQGATQEQVWAVVPGQAPHRQTGQPKHARPPAPARRRPTSGLVY